MVTPHPVAVRLHLPCPVELADVLARLVDEPGLELRRHDVPVHLDLGGALRVARVLATQHCRTDGARNGLDAFASTTKQRGDRKTHRC